MFCLHTSKNAYDILILNDTGSIAGSESNPRLRHVDDSTEVG